MSNPDPTEKVQEHGGRFQKKEIKEQTAVFELVLFA